MKSRNQSTKNLFFKIKHLKKQLLNSERFMTSVVNASFDAIITFDVKGNILYWNKSTERIFGYSTEEIASNNIYNFLKGSEKRKNQEVLNRYLNLAIQKNKKQTFEILFSKKNESFFLCEFSISCWKLNKSTYYTGVFRDTTERKNKNALIKKLSLAIRNSKDIVLMTGVDGIITYVNPEFTRVYGYEYNELVNKCTPRVIKGTDDDELFKTLWKTLKNGNSFKISAYKNKKRNGEFITVDSSIDPIINNDGKIIGYLGIQRDASQRIHNMEQLEKTIEKSNTLDKIKRDFLDRLSHELKTPLNAIIGLSNLIDENTELNEIIEYAKAINKSGEQLLSIYENIYNMSVLESKNINMSSTPINLCNLMHEINEQIKTFRIRENKEHLKLNLKIPNCVNCLINTDYIKLKQVMINLLQNALKFSEEGSINFGFKMDDKFSRYEFFVSDEGIGIDQIHQNLIFKGFTQVNGSYNRSYEGLGIGLTVANKLVKHLGGEIKLESEIGKGSKFLFYLPVKVKAIV